MGKVCEKRVKISDMDVQMLEKYLKQLIAEREALDEELENATKNNAYAGGMPFMYEEMATRHDGCGSIRYGHSYSLMMSDADYIALDLRDKDAEIKKVKERLEKLQNMCPGGNC